MVISEAEVPVPVLAEVVLVELWGELSQGCVVWDCRRAPLACD